MMLRLREIPCQMLARTAVQPPVLVTLIIQCATMATEVIEVAQGRQGNQSPNATRTGPLTEFFKVKGDISVLVQVHDPHTWHLDSNSEVNCKTFSQLLNSLGTPPLFTTVRVNTLRVTLDDALQELQDILDDASQFNNEQSRHFIVEKHHSLPDILVIHGFCPDVDIVPFKKEIIVDVQCGVAVLRGADVFAPGIMAAHPGIEKNDNVSVYADIDGNCLKGLIKPYDGAKIFIGNGVAVLGRNDVFCLQQNVSGVAVCMTAPLYSCPSLNGVLPHVLFLQNLPSVVVGHIMDPQSNEVILDMCASPGGKTTHLALLMGNKGKLRALDKSAPKIAKLKLNCERLGITSVESYVYDGTKALDHAKQWDKGSCPSPTAPPYPCGTFDRILVDAPCSALGQRPQFVVRMSLKELTSYPSLQRKLLTAAVGLLKEGGTLVYSTCTVTPQENEQQVAWALKSFPCLTLVQQSPHLGGPGFPNCGLSEDERMLVQRFDPAQLELNGTSQKPECDVDTIGFFIAKFVKTCVTEACQ